MTVQALRQDLPQREEVYNKMVVRLTNHRTILDSPFQPNDYHMTQSWVSVARQTGV